MKLIEKILSEENLNEAMKRVEANKGASGVDKMHFRTWRYLSKGQIQKDQFL